MQWFRFYSEALNDPKVQKLSGDDFKVWVNLLCLASSIDSGDGSVGTIRDVAYALRVTESAVTSSSHTLKSDGLITVTSDVIKITKWLKRQFKSDSSKERMRRHRERHKKVTVTAPEQSRTEQIQNREERTPLPPVSAVTKEEINFLEGKKNGRREKPASGTDEGKRIAEKILGGGGLA